MKKGILTLIITGVLLSLPFYSVMAQPPHPPGWTPQVPQVPGNNNGSGLTPPEDPAIKGEYYAEEKAYTLQNIVKILGEIRNFVLIVGIVIILIFLVWGGIDYMTARGDETKTAAARNKIVGAIVGAAVILAVYAILATVKNIIEQRSLV